MNLPLMTYLLARRLQQADADFTCCRMKQLREVPGNPYAVDQREFRGAKAFAARKLTMVTYFNKVVGLHDDSGELLDEILGFYGSSPFQIEILPCDLTRSLAGVLSERGYCQTSFHATLYGNPNGIISEIRLKGDVREAASPEDLRVYVDVNLSAWGVAPRFQADVGAVMLTSYGHSAFRHYIGYTLDGTPVSVATLYVTDGVAYYGNAGTVPNFRGKGYQALLLRRVASDAREAGCDLIVGMARFGSSSYRNMERIGMRLGFTQAIWGLP